MSYMLDTNVLSELVKAKPNPQVLAWFDNTPDEALHVSVLTLGELREGVERLPVGPRREKLRLWLETELPNWFGSRILPVTIEVADRWGRLTALAGRPLAAIDSLIAATALVHGLRVVTHNTRDFALPGIEQIDPWMYERD